MRQSEDHVEVGNGQQLGRTRSQPLGRSVALALGAVPVAARVIRDGEMSTAEALITMTTERCRTAVEDRVHYLAVLESEMRSVSFPEAVARCAENVGHLEGGSAHRLARLLECFTAFA